MLRKNKKEDPFFTNKELHRFFNSFKWEKTIKGNREIETLQKNLIHDEEYRDAWKANVAMAIYDTRKLKGETAHEWRQRCAEQFIKYLCAGHSDDPTSQMMEAIGH